VRCIEGARLEDDDDDVEAGLLQTCTKDRKASVSEDLLSTRVLLRGWNLNYMTVLKLDPRVPFLIFTRTDSIYCHSDKSWISSHTNYSG